MTEAKRRTTGIEWTEHTWNPFAGCSIHTPGCTHCYAMLMARRIEEMGMTSTYNGLTKVVNGKAVWTGKINRGSPETWRKPHKIKEPSIIFVNSMSDFWHEGAQDDWRLEALEIMASTPHQYQVLTKRPENILPFIKKHGVKFSDNVWIGATIERGDFNHRIETLRRVPAHIRFISFEPIIGPYGRLDLSGIHWGIGGGESGPGARGMDPDIARQLRDAHTRQGVAFFWKQWGKPENNPIFITAIAGGMSRAEAIKTVAEFDPVGKGGSKIDGEEWKQYPKFETLKRAGKTGSEHAPH